MLLEVGGDCERLGEEVWVERGREEGYLYRNWVEGLGVRDYSTFHCTCMNAMERYRFTPP